MRIDRPDDGDPVPATPDAPELRQAGAGAGKVRPASHDTPPEPAGAATRTERALQSRAKVDAAYRVADAVDQAYARVEKLESAVITPAMRLIEADDPGRHLAGLEHRLKGKDRVSEKVESYLQSNSEITVEEAFTKVKDAIRYTFQYGEQHYTEGVLNDFERLKGQFEAVDVRNFWSEEEYRGVNSRWRVPEDGQVFEVQFHTAASLEAKEVTHWAYEKIRSPSTSREERSELQDYQRHVSAVIPVPPDVHQIPNHP